MAECFDLHNNADTNDDLLDSDDTVNDKDYVLLGSDAKNSTNDSKISVSRFMCGTYHFIIDVVLFDKCGIQPSSLTINEVLSGCPNNGLIIERHAFSLFGQDEDFTSPVYSMQESSEQSMLKHEIRKKAFLSIHGIQHSQKQIELLCQQINKGSSRASQNERGTHRNRANKTPEIVVKSVRDHIDSIPKCCSHCNKRDKYLHLRPAGVSSQAFFLNYQRGKCTTQRIGINKFGAMAKEVATYLKLPNPELFTRHTFPRSCATLLIDGGENIMDMSIEKVISDKDDWCMTETWNVRGLNSKEEDLLAEFVKSNIRVLRQK
ncbi:hypothetical protein ILUMI_20134 [Ignelater luminosus]|uniref:Uncharacterized protein n=1 Tax=Ignelater luminosus TaxID=2038154 RepID=A0A8K0CGX4_IGNLU|nr:hypothetical protein ILUMI_20134 [Ignelater luminosus]